MHLCLWADGGREVLHHDGAAGTGAAGHCASGTCWDLTGQPGEGHLQLPQGKKVEGLELFVIGNIVEYKAWLYPDTQGPSEREDLHPPGQQGSMRRAKALVLEEQWLYSHYCFILSYNWFPLWISVIVNDRELPRILCGCDL